MGILVKIYYVNRYLHKTVNKLYSKLFELVKNKNYFVITINVDHQFQLAGFDKNNLFYMQGDYGLFQCGIPCHSKTYDNKEIVIKMLHQQKDMKIPNSLIPKCPVCGNEMSMNLRTDSTFVEDEGWHLQAKAYSDFIQKSKDKKLLLIDLGVGYNTPAIIRFPFEKMTGMNKSTHLIRINKDYAFCSDKIKDKTILFSEDISDVLDDLLK